ncbi:aminotransferase [Liquorilactobacillus satsumensis]|uniref:aminotransferase n=1 Tax=Liquorilactobacillus satsumensis TaxID=259059 RepID=UPI0021C2D71E|nr:aminotransferase [Liquorilactobacillus satsumensis]MCP9313277.1 aminotransferase [Liquorilactobacillus satsumensis]MCP9360473.1 aminotransferase [Liquorilactobacillus satsumensis]
MKLPSFGVEEWLNTWEKKAKYDISQSTISALTLQELIGLDGTTVAEFFGKYAAEKLNYGWIEGSPEFKKLVAQFYDKVDTTGILQANGATGANLLVMYALLEPGDEVISIRPSYQQLYDIPKSFGATVNFVDLVEEDRWQIDLGKLAKLVSNKTKMICLNSANNPTGTLLQKSVLEQIVQIARKVNAYVLVDEVYRPFTTKNDFPSIVDVYERGIATNSLSKTYSLPGLRIGWTASSKKLANVFRKCRDYTLICGGVLNDALAVHALKNRQKILARNHQILAENLKLLTKWSEQEPRVSFVMPYYVPTAFIRLDIPQDDRSFCTDLLQKTGVLLVPGSAFGVPQHARLGYCCSKKTLLKGLSLLSEYLQENF